MRDRSLLARDSIPLFVAWAETKGWVQIPTKGEYEVLRLQRGVGVPAIFYARLRGEHVTLHGRALALAQQWFRERKAEASHG